MRRSSLQDKVDPAEALMREVGAQLRQVRLERGEDLDTVAQYLRIKPAYLAGIEEGDLSSLPGRTYALGFLRSYADHLGFDGQDLVTQIKSAVGNLTNRQRLRIRTPMPESRLPKVPILAISLIVILAVYGAWSYVGGSGEPAVETVGEVPHELREVASDALAPPPRRPASAEPQSRAGQLPLPSVVASSTVDTPAGPADPSDQNGLEQAVSTPAPVRATPAPEGDSPQNPDQTQTAETRLVASARQGPAEGPAPGAGALQEDAFEPGAGPPAPPSSAQVLAALQESAGSDGRGVIYAAENADARVILRALGTSWVQVSSAAGDYHYVRTLEPGDAMLLPNRPDLSLWTGNAGGLQIIVDGRALPPFGAVGKVMRDIALDPESLLARSRSPLE